MHGVWGQDCFRACRPHCLHRTDGGVSTALRQLRAHPRHHAGGRALDHIEHLDEGSLRLVIRIGNLEHRVRIGECGQGGIKRSQHPNAVCRNPVPVGQPAQRPVVFGIEGQDEICRPVAIAFKPSRIELLGNVVKLVTTRTQNGQRPWIGVVAHMPSASSGADDLDRVKPGDYFHRFTYIPPRNDGKFLGEFRPEKVPIYCRCSLPYNPDTFMIMCSRCEDWFHPRCVGLSKEGVSAAIASREYACPQCAAAKGGGGG